MVGILVGAVVLVIAVTVAVVLVRRSEPTPTAAATVSPAAAASMGPEGMLLESGSPLADAPTTTTGGTIDGVGCNANEQAAQHIHTHLAIYVDGVLRPVPPGIGMDQPSPSSTQQGDFYQATQCYYWLHVHAQDGVIHVEAPTKETFTLGQFFAVWGQPLTAGQVGPAKGALTMFVGGKPYTGDPAAITIGSREDIQIDVGDPVVSPAAVDWSSSKL